MSEKPREISGEKLERMFAFGKDLWYTIKNPM